MNSIRHAVCPATGSNGPLWKILSARGTPVATRNLKVIYTSNFSCVDRTRSKFRLNANEQKSLLGLLCILHDCFERDPSTLLSLMISEDFLSLQGDKIHSVHFIESVISHHGPCKEVRGKDMCMARGSDLISIFKRPANERGITRQGHVRGGKYFVLFVAWITAS